MCPQTTEEQLCGLYEPDWLGEESSSHCRSAAGRHGRKLLKQLNSPKRDQALSHSRRLKPSRLRKVIAGK